MWNHFSLLSASIISIAKPSFPLFWLFQYFRPKHQHTATPAPTPAIHKAETGLKSNPCAPTDYKSAKTLPACTLPNADCTPAAIEAFAMPVVVKPTAFNPWPKAKVDNHPTAAPIATTVAYCCGYVCDWIPFILAYS